MDETLRGVRERERERTEKRTARTAGVNNLTPLRRSVSLEFFPTVIKGQKVIKSFFFEIRYIVFETESVSGIGPLLSQILRDYPMVSIR